MGLPVTVKENLSSSPESFSLHNGSGNGHRSSNDTNGVGSTSSEGGASYLFVYGASRPDAPASTDNHLGFQNQRAWLLGSRLYSFNTGGVRHAAVRLEESGHAVLGYAISTNNSMGIASLLDEYERREYSPDLYEREVVEVVTERGERLQSYIYYRADVNPSNLIPTGDWLRQ